MNDIRRAEGLKAVLIPLITGITLAVPGLFSPAASTQETSISNFNPAPALEDTTGYEHKLTQKQFDLLLSIVQPPRNSDILAACDAALATDLPPEWHRWIYLKRVQIYTYDSREDLAIKAAEKWLKERPNHRVNLGLQCVLLQICAFRESAAFHPTLQDLRKYGDPIFDAGKYPQACVDVIDAHHTYAEGLQRFYSTAAGGSESDRMRLMKEARDHLEKAEEILTKTASKELAVADGRLTASYIERTMRAIDPKLKGLNATLSNPNHNVSVEQIREMAESARKGH